MSLKNKILKNIINLFDDTLIQNDSKKNIIKFANSIPSEYFYFLSGLEFDLMKNSNGADFLISLSSVGNDSFSVVNEIIKKSKKSDVFKSQEWLDFIKLINIWEKNEFLKKHLENIWLEFDLSKSEKLSFIPGIFYGINQKTEIKSRNNIKYFINEMDYKYQNHLIHLDKIPFYNKFSHFAVFHSRNIDILRLFFTGVSINSIIDFVKNNNLKIHENNIEYIRKIENYFDVFSIHIDLSEARVLNKIGIEAYLNISDIYFYKNRIKLIKLLLSEINSLDCNKLNNLLLMNKIKFSPDFVINNSKSNEFNIGIHHFKFTFNEDLINAKIYYWFEGKWYGF